MPNPSELSRLMVAATWMVCQGAAAFQTSDMPNPLEPDWRAQVGLFEEEPMCMLNGPASHEGPRPLYQWLSWTASKGLVLGLKGHLKEDPKVRIEFQGGDAWDIEVELHDDEDDERHTLIAEKLADAFLRNVAAGRVLTFVISYENGERQRYGVTSKGARMAVPMFRACVKSMTDDPLRNWYQPKVRYMVWESVGGRCVFQQMNFIGHIPLFVFLHAGETGGEVSFHREIRTRNHHGPHQERQGPDRIEAQHLFTQPFDLLEEFRYPITTDQVIGLQMDLARGIARDFSLTSPAGRTSTLAFGGPHSKPAGAMFAACRKAIQDGLGTR